MYKGKLPHYHPIIIACFVKGKWLSRSIRRWLIDSCVQYPGPLSCSGPHLASRSGLLSTLTILLHAAGWVQVSLPILEASSENGYVIGDSWALPKKSLCCFSPPPPKTQKKITMFNCCHNGNLIQFTNLKWHLSLPHLSCLFHSLRNHRTELYTNLPRINISSFTFFLPTDKSQ